MSIKVALTPAAVAAALFVSCFAVAPSHAASTLGSQPICIKAWNGLLKKGKLGLAQTLVTKNCRIMYARGWLNNHARSSPQTPAGNPKCVAAWNGLQSDRPLARALVTHNCQILYNRGWLRINHKLK